ncbi:MAG: DNA repair protein RecO [Bdellovibrionota bacterium]
MKEFKGNFLILRKFPYGEGDLIIHALSEEGQKRSFIAKGGMRSKKRFGGGILEPTHHVTLLYKGNEKSEGTLFLLSEADLINDFPLIRKDYDRLEFGLSVVKAAAAVGQEGDQGSNSLYLLIGHTLKALEKVEDLETLKVQFYIKLLRQQGVLQVSEWMHPFIRESLHSSDKLKEVRLNFRDEVRRLNQMAEEYLKTAESHHSYSPDNAR